MVAEVLPFKLKNEGIGIFLSEIFWLFLFDRLIDVARLLSSYSFIAIKAKSEPELLAQKTSKLLNWKL